MFEDIFTAAKFETAHNLYRFPRSESAYASREEYVLAAATLNEMIQTIESHEFTTSIFANSDNVGLFKIEYYDDDNTCTAIVKTYNNRVEVLEC